MDINTSEAPKNEIDEGLKSVANKYWAAKDAGSDGRAIGSELWSKCRFSADQFVNNPILHIARKSYKFYYGLNDRGATAWGVGKTGEQNELSTLTVPHYQSLIRSTTSLVTQNRPGLQPVAINSDYKSQMQTKVASSILDYYVRKDLETKWRSMATEALVMGASYLKVSWDVEAGEIDPITRMKSGDVKFTQLTPFDVCFDAGLPGTDYSWVITREYENKYSLAARYSKRAASIMALGFNMSDRIFNPSGTLLTPRLQDSDQIPVYEFYHKPAPIPGLEQGRYVIFLSSDIVLYDGPLPTREIPLITMMAGSIMGTPCAHSPFWSLLGLQEAMNHVSSTLMTNMAMFGGATLAYAKNSGINRGRLGTGMNVFEVNSNEDIPKVLDMSPTNANAYQALEWTKAQMQLVSGINDVARGVPPPNLRSGAALAMIQSQAYMSVNDLEKQYVAAQENTGALLFEFLKTFATTKRSISVVNGKTNQYAMREFTGADISEISRVQVEIGSAIMRTPAGRMELAEKLMNIQNPEDRATYVNIMTTGRDDNATEAPFRKMMQIRSENEKLLDGLSVEALFLDDHAEHIAEHRATLDDPTIRENPMLVANIMRHIGQHLNFWKGMSPSELAIAGLQPLPPDAPPMPMPMPADPGTGVDGAADVAEGVTMQQTPVSEAGDVRMPNLPINPATGEQWDPNTGGL